MAFPAILGGLPAITGLIESLRGGKAKRAALRLYLLADREGSQAVRNDLLAIAMELDPKGKTLEQYEKLKKLSR